jgi:hypothetical protein
MFQAVPPPIIKSTQLYIQLQVLSTNGAASCYRQLTVSVSNLFLVLIACRCFFIGVALKDVDLPLSLSLFDNEKICNVKRRERGD